MSDPRRPDPTRLLARIQAARDNAGRGRLKVFLGAFPGAGKTFAMLEAARAAHEDGRDVLVGVVETHGRRETEILLAGLNVMPRRIRDHRGVRLAEFDLDAALTRHPSLLLVDELAHTNAPGSRHLRRWQDVDELLLHGIDVYTTINIQHIESLNDVVAQITGVTVRETVPDNVIDGADQLELVDVSPEVLEERLRAGKVYLPAQAARALEQFFRRGNLIALRELALRRTAQQVDAEMREWREGEGLDRTLPATERVLVAVPAGTGARRLVRTGWRLSQALRGECIALHVETPDVRRLPVEPRQSATRALHLAQELGARPVILSGERPIDELLAYARRENVTRIVVGRPLRPIRWPWQRSLAEELVAGTEAIDVHVVPLRLDAELVRRRRMAGSPAHPREFLAAIGRAILAAAIALPVRGIVSTTDVAMLFLLSVAITGARSGATASAVAAVASIALFDFVFVPPYYGLTVWNAQYLLTFVVMLGVGLAVAWLTSRIRSQAVAARAGEQRSAALLDFARELATARDPGVITDAARRRLRETLDAASIIQLADSSGHLVPVTDMGATPLDAHEAAVAQCAFDRRDPAGAGTATLPAAAMQWSPLVVGEHAIGVIGVEPPPTEGGPERQRFIDAISGQMAVAIERVRLAERTARDHVAIEAERLRTALLSSVSHDLRTPLGAVEGAADTMLTRPDLPESTRRELLHTIVEESHRMGRLIGNLLEMVRLETGMLEVQAEWQSVGDVVGIALFRLDAQLARHRVATRVPTELPLIRADGVLLEQAFVNIIENAAKYAPAGTAIVVTAVADGGRMVVSVDDEGPGVAEDDREAIFEKFHRSGAQRAAGSGLGLTIARGIAAAHGGTVTAEESPAGGLRIRIELPIPDQQPLAGPGDGEAEAEEEGEG